MISKRTRGMSSLPVGGATAAAVVFLAGLDLAVGSGRVSVGAIEANSEFLLAGIVGAAATALTLKRLEFGIILLPAVAAVVPVTLGTGTSSPVVASLLFAAWLTVLWLARMLVARDLTVLRSPVNAPLLGFTVTAILSTINSNAVRDPLVWVPASWSLIQVGGLSVFAASAGVLAVTMNGFRDWRSVQWLVWTVIGLGSFAMAGYLIRSSQDIPGFAVGGLFSLWVIVLALGQAVFNESLSAKVRVALLLLAAAWFFRRFFGEVDWLSGWVPATVAVLILFVLKSRKLFPLALVISIGVGVLRYDQIFGLQVSGAESQGNLLRLDLWQQNLDIARDHMLLGTGVAGYAVYYGTFFPDRALSSHSNYLDIFAQTGLVGSFFFVWLMMALLGTGFRARRRWRSGFAAGFVNGTLAGSIGLLVAMVFGDWFIPFVYNQTIAGFRYTVHSWLLLGTLAVAQHLRDDT